MPIVANLRVQLRAGDLLVAETDNPDIWQRVLKDILTAGATLATAAVLTGCPRDPPTPEPADCKKNQSACVDQPAPEGPPPVGTQAPRGAAR